MRKMAWVIQFLFALPSLAVAASFECEKAVTKVEKLICSDDELSILDEKLSDAYKNSLQRADIKQRAIISQRQWLKKSRNPCTEADCVKAAYETRIQEIELMSSFGIVILNAQKTTGGKPARKKGKTVESDGTLMLPANSVGTRDEASNAIQPCVWPDVVGLEGEEAFLLLMNAVKKLSELKQYGCVVEGMEAAHRIVQAIPDEAKRAEWGFELKDFVLPLIRSNEISNEQYEKRLLYAATQSLKEDWSPDFQATEDERFNDTAFLGSISDHYRKESDSGIFSERTEALRKLYPIDLAMLRINFSLSEGRRWAMSQQIESFFNDTNRAAYLDDMYTLWADLPNAVRQINQKKLSQGILKATAGHVISGYELLSPDEAKRSIEVVRGLLKYVPQEPVGWQTDIYLAEAYWQSGGKGLAHEYFERARYKDAPYISKGFHLLSMAKYLCSRRADGKFLQLCPFGIYSKDEMGQLLDELEKMAETDSVVEYKIEKVRAMRRSLINGSGQ